MNALKILKPGLLTTVQDAGRPGFMKYGIPLCGAMDQRSMRAANSLLGNTPGAAVLEITMTGPEFVALTDISVAVTGARFDVLINGASTKAEVLSLAEGDRVKFSRLLEGARAYLALSGGVDVPLIMGSRSTYVPGAFGGFEGRSLRTGDILNAGADQASASESPKITPLNEETTVRVVPGAEADQFSPAAAGHLLDAVWQVSPDSNRMGLRLTGPVLEMQSSDSMISTGLMPGSVQLPSGGQPIVIMRDGQTTGGYPRIFHVLSEDIDLLAQARGGSVVRFVRA